ncbi:hypothetical protein TNCV_599201 [Trichonephila clavipes]|nr:hypothetical protein TNCV_599201 [Trichonephila clavipes]
MRSITSLRWVRYSTTRNAVWLSALSWCCCHLVAMAEWTQIMRYVHQQLVLHIEGRSERSLSSTLFLPSRNSLYHSETIALPMTASPKASLTMSLVSLPVLPSFTQNLMAYSCTRKRSMILRDEEFRQGFTIQVTCSLQRLKDEC